VKKLREVIDRQNAFDDELLAKVKNEVNIDHPFTVDMFDGTGRTGMYIETGYLRSLLDRIELEGTDGAANEMLPQEAVTGAQEMNEQYGDLRKEKNLVQAELDAVMHSVDKWLDGDDLKNNPATRAADAREIALRLIDAQAIAYKGVEGEVDRLRARTHEIQERADRRIAERDKKIENLEIQLGAWNGYVRDGEAYFFDVAKTSLRPFNLSRWDAGKFGILVDQIRRLELSEARLYSWFRSVLNDLRREKPEFAAIEIESVLAREGREREGSDDYIKNVFAALDTDDKDVVERISKSCYEAVMLDMHGGEDCFPVWRIPGVEWDISDQELAEHQRDDWRSHTVYAMEEIKRVIDEEEKA